MRNCTINHEKGMIRTHTKKRGSACFRANCHSHFPTIFANAMMISKKAKITYTVFETSIQIRFMYMSKSIAVPFTHSGCKKSETNAVRIHIIPAANLRKKLMISMILLSWAVTTSSPVFSFAKLMSKSIKNI